MPLLRNCPRSRFAETVKALFPTPNAEALLEAYNIPTSGSTDANRVWMQMSVFLGDMMFSADYHRLSNNLANHVKVKKRKVYRYSFCLSNPFPGSCHSFATGHHFIEVLFVFLTFLDRYPTHRHRWLERIACETARRWILFANGHEPWDAYTASNDGSVDEAKIAICDDLVGWTVRTLKEDEEVSKNDPWGERRYAGWKAFAAAFDALRHNKEDANSYGQKVNTTKLKILQTAFKFSDDKGALLIPELAETDNNHKNLE